jgi:UDP-glucuronate 4-epimerase
MRILLTGVAGFIGSHLNEKLLSLQHEVTGIDNFDPFYPKKIKESNLATALANPNFTFIEADICEPSFADSITNKQFDIIIHIAAKAGVRPSMLDPISYNKTNIMGTTHLLEFARQNNIKRFIFASSSSVYGVNPNLPWKVEDKDLQPISIYAFSKQSGEKLCELYHKQFGLNITALRFFTVFGPRQRPDLAIHKFVKAIDNDEKITLYGNGNTFRDYTYVGDIVNGIMGAVDHKSDEYEIFNLGNTHTVSLMELVNTIEDVLGKKAKIEFMPEQQGDVPYTWSDVTKSRELLGYNPQTGIREGISKFIGWYKGIK